jgi:C-terminal processing protease CtpA/Prc
LLEAVEAHGPTAQGVTAEALGRACGTDLLCAARRIVAGGDGRARLERRDHPDTDTIRWVTTRASLRFHEQAGDGRMVVALERFGRKVEWELRAALADQERGKGLVLDLRDNRGGDFGRMLRVAGLFTGALPDALYLVGRAGRRPVAIPGNGTPFAAGALTVLVGPETASSGEILAALLRRYAGAVLAGQRTLGKDYLLRVVALDQDWRLLLPAERVEVPGETLAGGLVPDRPLPPGGSAP